MIKVIISGSDTFNDYILLEKKCNQLLQYPPDEIEIICADGTGADKLGKEYAGLHGIKLTSYAAKNKTWAAMFLRNESMVKHALTCQMGTCIIFWDGKSFHCEHLNNVATHFKLRRYVIRS